jgi:hypothetical protein
LVFSQLDVFFPFCQIVISSTWHFVNLPFC